ncbi:MAG: Trypsin-like peptidase domain [Candidatus Parcubacteria bacterium]|jgi:S1-C subfamily serine protease
MNIFVDVLVYILSTYLALTSALATHIESWLPSEPDADAVEETQEEVSILSLPSIFGQSIPDILLRSKEYQQAALGAAAGLTGSTTNDPFNALVNIFCTFQTKDHIRTTTGTGFFIDPDGIIMTNAHIGQFLILEKTDSFGDADCIVRTGSPAAPQYRADLLYIPPTWIRENASLIDDAAPMGTGERDYALLYVSETTNGAPLPAKFPALAYNDELLPSTVRDDNVVAAGYPARDLIKNGANTDLLAKRATTTISELYTFGSNYADVFSVRGSVVGAEGASGGPIVDTEGAVIGMIATRGDDAVDGEGSLRAITLSHINRTIKEETGFSLTENLAGDLPYRAKVFADTMLPFLVQVLEEGKEQ